MAFSYNVYTGDGTTTQFAVPFGYIRREHVLATVAGSPATFTWVNDSLIQMDVVPANGATVRVYRQTPLTNPLVDFTDGSTLVAADLDTNAKQSIYTQQELDDSLVDGLAGVIPNGDKGDITTSVNGSVWTIDNGAVTSAKIADGTIVDGDISANAEIAVSKLADGTARQLLQTDAAGTGVEWTSNVDVPGTLDVTGAATFDSTVTTTGAATFSSTVTATGNVTVPSLNGGPLAGARNILINGLTVIDQRNGGAALTLNNSAGFVVDRWNVNAVGGAGTGTATAQRVVDAPAGFTTSLKWTTTNAKTPAAADTFYVWQAIEGHNIDHIGFNTASAKPLTLSFWVKSSLTGTFSGFCRQQSSAPAYRSYVFTYTISSANTWEYKTVGILADPSSGFAPNVDGNSGLGILFDMGSGSTYETGTTGAWQSGDYFRSTGAVRVISTLNATWQVTGVQLETGTVATPFERRSYGQELALCQRYFARLDNASTLPVSTNASTERGFFKLPVTMRATPNCTFAYDLGGTGATWALGPDGGYQSIAHSTITGFSVSATAEF